jgi:hypothetical protein
MAGWKEGSILEYGPERCCDINQIEELLRYISYPSGET